MEQVKHATRNERFCKSGAVSRSISVVIPLYNKEKQISRTLESVFRQTFQDFEVVIVDDGSSDNSVDIVKKFEDKRISIISQLNQGVSVARNTGINHAKYDYIALLDADDEWNPDYLQEQVNLINNYPECNVFVCAYGLRNYKGELKQIKLNKIPFTSQTGVLTNYFEVASCSHPPICSINIVAGKESFLSIGGFPVGVKSGEDLLTWAKLAVKYKIAFSKKVLAIFILNRVDKNIPRKLPDENDYVGQELIKIKKQLDISYLNRYISKWYQMRAVNYFEGRKRKKAIRNILRAITIDLCYMKNYVWMILLVFPYFLYKMIRK